MAKFVDCERDSAFLLPLDLREWIPEDDLAHFVIEVVDRVDVGTYWLLHRLRRLAPKKSLWRGATFQTIKDAFLKIAARVTELKSRITIALPTAYPHHKMLVLLAVKATAQGP